MKSCKVIYLSFGFSETVYKGLIFSDFWKIYIYDINKAEARLYSGQTYDNLHNGNLRIPLKSIYITYTKKENFKFYIDDNIFTIIYKSDSLDIVEQIEINEKSYMITLVIKEKETTLTKVSTLKIKEQNIKFDKVTD